MYMSKKIHMFRSELLIWSSLNNGDKMYLQRAIHCSLFWTCLSSGKDEITVQYLQEMFTSLPWQKVELVSLAQNWTSDLKSFASHNLGLQRVWGDSHCDCLMDDYELPICLMQKILWADTFSSQLRAGHPNFQASRFNSEIKLIYSSCH